MLVSGELVADEELPAASAVDGAAAATVGGDGGELDAAEVVAAGADAAADVEGAAADDGGDLLAVDDGDVSGVVVAALVVAAEFAVAPIGWPLQLLHPFEDRPLKRATAWPPWDLGGWLQRRQPSSADPVPADLDCCLVPAVGPDCYLLPTAGATDG